MGIISKIASRIRDIVRRKPTPPTILPGNRGYAIGLGATADEVNRRAVGSDEIKDFVYNGEILIVHSSNVSSAVYSLADKKLIIEYHSGDVWSYGNINEQEAIGFAQAQSKGGFIWQHIRVRGSKTQHKKPAVKIR